LPRSWLLLVEVPVFAGENQGPVLRTKRGKNRAELVYMLPEVVRCWLGLGYKMPGLRFALCTAKNAQNPSSAYIRG
jgi:hypothetical protein